MSVFAIPIISIIISILAIIITISYKSKIDDLSKAVNSLLDSADDLDNRLIDLEVEVAERPQNKKKKQKKTKKDPDILPEDFLIWKNKKIPSEFLYPKKELEDNGHILFGKKVVISGEFDTFPIRYELAEYLWNIGVDVDTGIGKYTDYLFCGDGCGPSKLRKAKEGDIKIVEEEEIKELIPDFKSRFV